MALAQVARKLKRRFNRHLRVLILAALMAFIIALGLMSQPPGFIEQISEREIPLEQEKKLDEIARNIVSGGPPKDGIPPIDNPRYLSAGEARLLKDSDIVFGVNYRGVVKAYPQKLLVWHEIVNEDFGGERASATYCPLTGSVIGFIGRLDSTETTFGTSGKLANSCLVMYDRATDSYWPQILGRAVTGPSKSKKLQEFPVVWTTWGRWRRAFPETLVLSTETGFVRSYGVDPYGSYERNDTYYQTGGPFFPVLYQSDRFVPKQVFIGIEDGVRALAVKKERAKDEKVIQTKLGEAELVIIYDDALDDALAYKSNGRAFRYANGRVVDDSGTAWNIWGVSDTGERLEHVNSFNVMWFAWYAFYPDTEVYG